MIGSSGSGCLRRFLRFAGGLCSVLDCPFIRPFARWCAGSGSFSAAAQVVLASAFSILFLCFYSYDDVRRLTSAGRLAPHGRLIDADHEREILNQLRWAMQRHRLPLELTVFTGAIDASTKGEALPIQKQAALFGEAVFVVGPHGGALANLLWLPVSGASGTSQPVVLEFVCGNRSRAVQAGCPYLPTYWSLFTGASWVEYHQLAFSVRSGAALTQVDLTELRMALDAIYAPYKAVGADIV